MPYKDENDPNFRHFQQKGFLKNFDITSAPYKPDKSERKSLR